LPSGPDSFADSAVNIYKGFMYASIINQDKFSDNVFAYDDTSAAGSERNNALFEFAAEARELQNSVQSMFPLLGAEAAPTVAITTTPHCERYATRTRFNPRKPWQGPVNCGVYGRA